MGMINVVLFGLRPCVKGANLSFFGHDFTNLTKETSGKAVELASPEASGEAASFCCRPELVEGQQKIQRKAGLSS
jgi:hypothetical protein